MNSFCRNRNPHVQKNLSQQKLHLFLFKIQVGIIIIMSKISPQSIYCVIFLLSRKRGHLELRRVLISMETCVKNQVHLSLRERFCPGVSGMVAADCAASHCKPLTMGLII